MNKKALILVENLSVPFDIRVWREAKALQEAGYQVTAISPKGTKRDTLAREEIDGIVIYRFRLFEAGDGLAAYVFEYGLALLMMGWLTLRAFVARGFHVIQICNPPDLLFFITLPYKLLGVKVVFDHHDLSPELYAVKKGTDDPGAVGKVLHMLERLTFFFSDAVMSTNESFKRLAVERGGKREDQVLVVRNGPELRLLKETKPNPELKAGRAFLIVYVGVMGSQDGVDYLLRAVKALRGDFERDDFQVLLVGDGPEFDNINRYAEELGLLDCITFSGRVPHEAALQAIATADVCVCPDPKNAQNDKSTLVKVVEYMALGKPTVGFDLTETRASAGDSALYATPNEEKDLAAKINQLLDSSELREQLGAIGKERILTSMAWDHSKENLLAAYESVFK